MVNLPNNTLLSAYNDSPTRRTPLALATSTNGGKTWTRVAVVEDATNGSFHYPNVFYVPRDVRALAALVACRMLVQPEMPAVADTLGAVACTGCSSSSCE